MRGVLRPRGFAVSLATVVAAASVSTGVAAAADGQNTLYVNNTNANCTDSGSGTYATPFCTIQAAADVANPGDVVNVAAGNYASTTITRSGTSAAPIVFTGNGTWNSVGSTGGANVHGLYLTGASDVEIENFRLLDPTAGDAVVVSGGSDLTFTHDLFATALGSTSVSLHITGAASGVTVRDSRVVEGILVDGGSTGTVVTTNLLYSEQANGTAVAIAGATNSAVTSNTIDGCGPVVSVTGSSTGTSIENNVITAGDTTSDSCSGSGEYGILADSGSAASTTADYNDVYAENAATAYDWSGTSYATGSALYTAVGKGQHDDNSLKGTQLIENSPLISSANSAAVGEQSVDIYGNARGADPLVTSAGAGPYNYYDRGAEQFQDPLTPVKNNFTASATQAPVNGTITLNAAFTDTWSDSVTYELGVTNGGSATNTTGSASVTVPSTPGDYEVYEYVSPPGSSALHFVTYSSVKVVAAAPLVPRMVVFGNSARNVVVGDYQSTDSWNIVSETYDFGDGTKPVTGATSTDVSHTYATAGTYKITETVTDAGGNTATTTASFSTNATAAGTLMQGTRTSSGDWGNAPWTTPSGGTGIAQAAITGLPHGSSLVAAVTTSGTVEYDIRNASGTWQGWIPVSQPGVTVESVSAAGMPNGTTQFTEVTSTGTMRHDIRNADGSWQASGWGTPAGSTGIARAAITAMPNGSSQLVAVTTSGVLEHDIRNAGGSWQGWRSLGQSGVKVTDASIAGMPDGSSQITEVTSAGVLKHDIRYANGSWQASGWGSPAGSTGVTQASIAALPNGSTVFTAVLSGGGCETDVRNANGSWTGWSVFNSTYLPSAKSCEITGMSDGSAQLAAVSDG